MESVTFECIMTGLSQVSNLIKLLYISVLKGQKHDKCFNAFALTGRMYSPLPTRGVALGYWLIGLSGRPNVNPKLLYYDNKLRNLCQEVYRKRNRHEPMNIQCLS